MVKRIAAGLLPVLMMLLLSPLVKAQFQGKIIMNLYNVEEAENEQSTVSLYVTKDRLFFEGSLTGGVGLASTGLLIRNDEKDFIFLMDKGEALKVTKTEIEGFIGMMSAMASMGNAAPNGSSNANDEVQPKIRYTDKTKTINGFKASELIIEETAGKNKGDYISIWLTPDVDINWGILSEPWKNLPKEMEATVNGTLRQNIFNGNNFPVLVESYDAKKGKLEKIMDVSVIEKAQIAQAQVEVPQGVKLLGINDMMRMMMSNH